MGRDGLLAGTGKRFGLEVVMTEAMKEAQAKLAEKQLGIKI